MRFHDLLLCFVLLRNLQMACSPGWHVGAGRWLEVQPGLGVGPGFLSTQTLPWLLGFPVAGSGPQEQASQETQAECYFLL